MAERRVETDGDPQVGGWPQSELDDLIGYNLKRAYVITQADFRKALTNDMSGPRVFSALMLVSDFPNITQSELARMLGIERSGLVAIVDELEALSYLQRTTVPGDRRVQALVATKKGEAARQKTLKLVQEHEERLFAFLTQDERDTLIGLLRKIRKFGTD